MAKSYKSVYLVWAIMFVSVSGILYANTSTTETFLFDLPPELRTVGGCFRDCIDDTQTGFSGQGAVVSTDETIDDKKDTGLLETVATGITAVFSGAESSETVSKTSASGTSSISELPVICEVKTSVQGLDISNGVIQNSESSLFSKNNVLSLDLANPTNNEIINSFNMVHKMKCYNDNNNMENITVQSSEFKSTIYGKTMLGNEVNVWNSIVKSTNEVSVTDDNEKVLSSHSADVTDIHKFLPKGEYKTTLRFQTTGNINLVNDDTGKSSYIAIRDNSIKTEITLDVVKKQSPPENTDTDGDGFLNNVDACPATYSKTNNGCPEEEKEKGDDNEVTDILTEFSLCISNFDMSCLMNQKFLPMYLGMTGLIFLVGAMTTRKTQVFDSFGNRI